MQHSAFIATAVHANPIVVYTDHLNYNGSLPSIWCEAQLQYTARVTFEDGIILTLSINIPQVYRTHK